MAYKTEDLRESALISCKNENVYFIADIIALLPCGRTSFYEHFQEGSEGLEELKSKLTDNKVSMKIKLRKMLSEGGKAAEILALYKLIGNDDERKALSQNYHDHTSKGEKIKPNVIDLSLLDNDTLEKLMDAKESSN